jgi:hypothetical protein
MQSANHSWTLNLGSAAVVWTRGRLLDLSKTAVVERAMLELCRGSWSYPKYDHDDQGQRSIA